MRLPKPSLHDQRGECPLKTAELGTAARICFTIGAAGTGLFLVFFFGPTIISALRLSDD